MTYHQVVQDAVDLISWAQNEQGTGRGGWYYYPNQNTGDNSVSQWPVLALIAAEKWGIHAPQFVKDELNFWVNYIQNHDSSSPLFGGSGYHNPTQWVNIGKTGGLLVQHHYLGDASTTQRVLDALDFINRHWEDSAWGWDGNKGSAYAMFGVFKGLKLMNIHEIPNAPPNQDSAAKDWWGDYAHYIVNTQSAQGYWSAAGVDHSVTTPWYIMILQATVFPVSVHVDMPAVACDNDIPVEILYSAERFPGNGTLTVYRDDIQYDAVLDLVNFQGSAIRSYHLDNETHGEHTWRAELEFWSPIATSAYDETVIEVLQTPLVQGIPDQFMPFDPVALDNYVTCDCNCSDIEWTAIVDPADPIWMVDIDPDSHVATVIAPEGATDSVLIAFQATMTYFGIPCTGEDNATFTPNQFPVANAGKSYPDNEFYSVCVGDLIHLDGTGSMDPDGFIDNYTWWDESGTLTLTGPEPVFSTTSNPDWSGGDKVWVHLKVCDNFGACAEDSARVKIYNCVIFPISEVCELSDIQTHSITAEVSGHSLPYCEGNPSGLIHVDFEIYGANAGTEGVGDPADCSMVDEGGSGSVGYTYNVDVAPNCLGEDTITATFRFPDNNFFTRTATVTWVDTIPPTAACEPGPNPAGHIRGKNSDGFFTISATDNVGDIFLYVVDSQTLVVFPDEAVFGQSFFPNATNIKYTQAPGADPEHTEGAGVVACHLKGQGDARIEAQDSSGNVGLADCHVPPPNKFSSPKVPKGKSTKVPKGNQAKNSIKYHPNL